MFCFSVEVFVGSGSRQDNYETTGASYLLRKMLTRGSPSFSRARLSEEIEGMGARLTGSSEREHASLGLNVFKADVGKAVSILGEAFSQATLDSAEVELAK